MPRFTPLLLVVLLASCCSAGDHPPLLPPGDPAPCTPPVIVQTVPKRQVLLVPHEEATTLLRLKLREVEVGRAPGGPIVEFVEKKCMVTEMQIKECEVEQKVVVIENKPELVPDPITGKPCTVVRQCPVEKIIKVKVARPVPVQREVVIRVPVLKPGPDLVVTKMALDVVSVAAVKTTYSAVDTFNNITAVVPAPPPLPLPPPPPSCPHCKPH